MGVLMWHATLLVHVTGFKSECSGCNTLTTVCHGLFRQMVAEQEMASAPEDTAGEANQTGRKTVSQLEAASEDFTRSGSCIAEIH